MQWPEIALVVLIVVHIIVCVLIFLGIQFRILKVRKLMFWVALLMPVWGPALVLALHIQIALKQSNKTEVGVEKFQVASELYKGIKQDTSRTPGFTVSMEEALIVNTPKERRSLIMDILNDNPQAYVEFLKMAGNNEDTEVVHYAVTAMVQISKENDQILWELEQKYAQAPNDLDTIMTYCGFLWHCLDQGLMQGQVERMNRNLFDTLIHKKSSWILRISPTISAASKTAWLWETIPKPMRCLNLRENSGHEVRICCYSKYNTWRICSGPTRSRRCWMNWKQTALTYPIKQKRRSHFGEDK